MKADVERCVTGRRVRGVGLEPGLLGDQTEVGSGGKIDLKRESTVRVCLLGRNIQRGHRDCDARQRIALIVLIVLILMSFVGGFYQPTYRTHGVSLGTVLLIVLLLWIFGVLGSRPF